MRCFVKGLAMLMLLAGVCNATDMGILKGTVTRPGGVGEGDVLVRVEHWTLEHHDIVVNNEKVAYTGGTGQYSLELPPGVYDVFISGAAFTPVARRVEIKPGEVTVLSPEMHYDRLVKVVD